MFSRRSQILKLFIGILNCRIFLVLCGYNWYGQIGMLENFTPGTW